MARAYRKSEETIPVAEIREILHYDPLTGVFRWKVPFRGIGINAIAGKTTPDGGRAITYKGRTFQATRLAWMHYYGTVPEGHVVPKNGDKADLRIDNLKDQPRSETVAASSIRSTNRSGFRGVSWNSRVQKWVASITRNQRRVHLGFFAAAEDASAAVEKVLSEGIPEGKGSFVPKDPTKQPRKRWITREIAFNAPHLIGFQDATQMAAELGEQPSDQHVITRINLMKPIGPGNVEWRLPWLKGGAKRRYHLAKNNFPDALYEQRLKEQDGLCAICRRPERQSIKGTDKSLSGDHDHVTGLPRGVLCMACNAMLGAIDDDPGILRRAADYLEHYAALNAADHIERHARSDRGEE